ncbi:hypothetical protein WOC68_10230 [Staphylococcus aureus]
MLAIESLLILFISVLVAPANLHITSAGTIGRATSAKKYKISIENQYINEDDQFSHSKEILKLPIRTMVCRI